MAGSPRCLFACSHVRAPFNFLLASSGLVPQLTAIDTPVLGNAAIGYRLANARPGNLSMARYDFTRSAQPFGPCTLLMRPIVVQFAVANGAGVAAIAHGPRGSILADAAGCGYPPTTICTPLLTAIGTAEVSAGSIDAPCR